MALGRVRSESPTVDPVDLLAASPIQGAGSLQNRAKRQTTMKGCVELPKDLEKAEVLSPESASVLSSRCKRQLPNSQHPLQKPAIQEKKPAWLCFSEYRRGTGGEQHSDRSRDCGSGIPCRFLYQMRYLRDDLGKLECGALHGGKTVPDQKIYAYGI